MKFLRSFREVKEIRKELQNDSEDEILVGKMWTDKEEI